MLAGKYNITIEQGSDFVLQMQVKDSVTKAVVDLSGCTARGMIREKFTDLTPLATFTFTAGDLTQGQFSMSLTHVTTTTLTFAKGVYDIELVYPSGLVDRILQGNAVLSLEVTK